MSWRFDVLTEPGLEESALQPGIRLRLGITEHQSTMDMEMIDLNPMAQLSHDSYLRFAEYITKELGIKMPEAKQMLIQNRLLRRVRELGMQSVEEYSRYFFGSADMQEREQLINAITTNKTDFFREPEHFEFLKKTVLSSFKPRPGWPNQLLAWSAACSSGEEPYTMAMVLNEYAAVHPAFSYTILATDISTKVLQRARQAIYPEERIAPIAPALRSRYLLRSRNAHARQVRIVPLLRQRVSFHQLNLMDANYRVNAMFDVIFLRNVLIYFDRDTQEAVIKKLCRYLAPGGYLFVSHSESLAGMDIPIAAVQPSIFRKPVEGL